MARRKSKANSDAAAAAAADAAAVAWKKWVDCSLDVDEDPALVSLRTDWSTSGSS